MMSLIRAYIYEKDVRGHINARDMAAENTGLEAV